MTRPRIVRLWRCDVCGAEAEWGPGWMWFTDGARPRKLADPEVVAVVCSEACRQRSQHRAEAVR